MMDSALRRWPTRYTKIVVTDDKGRFLVPDLPKAIKLQLRPDPPAK